MIIKCSGCLKPLCEVIKLEGKLLNGDVSVAASCPYCGDKSLPEWFDKKIATSGYTVLDNSMPDGYREVTLISKRSMEGNKYFVEVIKCP